MARQILEIKQRLSGETLEFSCQLCEQSGGEAVVRYRVPKETALGGLRIPEGSLSFGYFWERRPYNVYHFVSPEGVTIAFYCNISDSTRISAEKVHWRDLVVDVLIVPGGEARVLDEHELPENIDPVLLTQINRASNEVIKNIRLLIEELTRRTAGFLQGH